MKTRRVLILVLMAAIVAVAIAALFLRKPEQPSPPPARAAPPEQHPQATGPAEAVVAYLEALSDRDFRAAYEYLSAESRAAHPYDEFIALCQESTGPSLDLGSASEHPAEGDRVTVIVSMLWDPAEASFTTEQEEGAWRVVFIKGKPWFPYP